MDNESTITPKNWSEFQHYKDRRPSWIKLHKTILDDPTFNRLPVASQALAPKLWLLASEYENGAITLPPDDIAYRLRISIGDFSKALSPLVEAGYFVSGNGLSSVSPEINKGKDKEEKKQKPSQQEVSKFCTSIGLPGSDGAAMFLHWEEKGWGKVKNWKLTIQKWKAFGYLPSQKQQKGKPQLDHKQQKRDDEVSRFLEERKHGRKDANGATS